MVKLLKYLFIFCSLLVVLLMCCTNNEEKVKTTLGQEFSLRIGQIAQINRDELEIKFEQVVEDSRCPKGVTCIWAGQVSCELQIKDKESSSNVKLTEPGSPGAPNQITYKKYRIFYHIQPYPEANKKISHEDYELILKIEKLL
jgi:hypothetical protein